MKKLEHIPINDKLPSPKGVALAILELCNSEGANYSELARIAQVDPALAGRLIRQANSAYTASRRPAVSVIEAINRLGLATVRNLALGFSLIDEYREGPCKAFDYQTFWSHSLLMALAMQHLSAKSGAGSIDELFACGLLARIGCLALATAYPREYEELLQAEEDIPLLQRERQRLHTDHNELSTALLLEWGIPPSLAEPIYHHENPDAADYPAGSRQQRLAQHFYLAKRVADLGIAPESEHGPLTAELLLLASRIGLNSDELGTAVDDLVSQWQEWGELLNVPASVLPSFASMSATNGQSQEGEDKVSLRILLATADRHTGKLLAEQLGDYEGHQVSRAEDGHQAMAMVVEKQPQLVIVDRFLPELDGLELCQTLRETDWGRTLYLIMMQDEDSDDGHSAAFEAGVDSTLSKPVTLRGVRSRLQAALRYTKLLEAWEQDRTQLNHFAAELATSNRQLSHAAMTDQLTGLPNRRSGMDFLERAWNTAIRSAQPLSALVIDIDHFKDINDTYGHATGDKALREIAQVLLRSARRDESISRIGGEEFLIICQNSDVATAVKAAERLRKVVGELELKVGNALIRPTLSIGVASREPGMVDADSLVREADHALYHSKRTGRDRVCLSANGELRCGPW